MATVTTAWTSPASATLDKSTGAIVDEAMMDAIASNLYSVGGTLGYIGCRAYNSATISIPNAVETAVLLNSERFDTDPNGAIHDTSTNTSRLVCRTTGLYLITGCIEWAGNSSGYRYLHLVVNGATAIAIVSSPSAGAAVLTGQIASTVYLLSATDYVEMRAFQDCGIALNINATGNRSPELSLVKL